MAGRPRLPQKVAEITGAVGKNPQMFRGRANPKVRSLGPAPKAFNDEQKELWDEFNEDFPWLGRSDRKLVRSAVMLEYQMLTEPEVPVAVYAQMRLLLSSMGGTPVDRSKVAAPEEEKDPADEFIN